jgi:MSHA pilin protein MshD
MFIRSRPRVRKAQRGISLVELVLFIVIVSIAVGGVLLVMNLNTRHSADPLLQKQALAVAEALLEEVELMPYMTCDPDGYDAAAGTCVKPEAMGPEAAYANQAQAEARGSAVAPFDNVNDYDGFTLTGGGTDLGSATNVVVPAGYSASVAVTQDAAFGPSGSPLPAAAVLRIAVIVTYGGGSVVVEGYRTQYAPTVTP